MTAGTAPANNQVAQIATLIERVETVLRKLENVEKRMDASSCDTAEFRADYERRHAVLDAKVDAAHKRIDEHERNGQSKWAHVDAMKADLQSLRDIIIELKQSNRLLSWFSGILGSAVLLWLVGQILGLVTP